MNSKDYFDSIATNWDNMRQGFFRENLSKKTFETAQIQPDKTAADIGAGTGFIAEDLIKRGLHVIAIDQAEAMLEVLKSKLPSSAQIDCRTGEAESLPIDDNHVDYVFANMYLHHVLDPADAIKEMVRILKSGGVLVIIDMDNHSFVHLKSEHHDRWMGFEQADVHRWLEAAGLKVVQVQCIDELCCAKSSDGKETYRVSIFIASGKKSELIVKSTKQ